MDTVEISNSKPVEVVNLESGSNFFWFRQLVQTCVLNHSRLKTMMNISKCLSFIYKKWCFSNSVQNVYTKIILFVISSQGTPSEEWNPDNCRDGIEKSNHTASGAILDFDPDGFRDRNDNSGGLYLFREKNMLYFYYK